MDFLNNNMNLKNIASQYKNKYLGANPFPHIVLNDIFNPELLNNILNEFPDLSKKNVPNFENKFEKKLGTSEDKFFGTYTSNFLNYLNSQNFLSFLQEITAIKETLTNDPYYLGGGLHEIKNGGYLKIHADFNKHTMTKLDRRINVLIYLNKNWLNQYGGNLELWDKKMEKCVQSIQPSFNTMVIFNTTDFAYHGHPDPLLCPENISRKSLALYYYSNGRPKKEINLGFKKHDTIFKKRYKNNGLETNFKPYLYLKQKLNKLFFDK